MQTDEILNAPPAVSVAGDAPEHPTTAAPSAVPSVEPSSTEVLITEQQVMFSTAAALASRRGNRFAAIVGRLFATSTAESRESRPRRQQSQPRRTYYIERGRMAREMERL
jgi:hypothetical protein